nr:helix-turn-helix transcriptional regulator [Streptobacillus ratti]
MNYKKLWKLLIDKNMNKHDLHVISGISTSTISKMSNEKYVSLEVLERICNVLDCEIGDILEFGRKNKL